MDFQSECIRRLRVCAMSSLTAAEPAHYSFAMYGLISLLLVSVMFLALLHMQDRYIQGFRKTLSMSDQQLTAHSNNYQI